MPNTIIITPANKAVFFLGNKRNGKENRSPDQMENTKINELVRKQKEGDEC